MGLDVSQYHLHNCLPGHWQTRNTGSDLIVRSKFKFIVTVTVTMPGPPRRGKPRPLSTMLTEPAEQARNSRLVPVGSAATGLGTGGAARTPGQCQGHARPGGLPRDSDSEAGNLCRDGPGPVTTVTNFKSET